MEMECTGSSNVVKFEMPVDEFETIIRDMDMYKEKSAELNEILDLIFDATELGIDDEHLHIGFDNDLMTYLKIKKPGDFYERLAELNKKEK